jgi:hypothetical protein
MRVHDFFKDWKNRILRDDVAWVKATEFWLIVRFKDGTEKKWKAVGCVFDEKEGEFYYIYE